MLKRIFGVAVAIMTTSTLGVTAANADLSAGAGTFTGENCKPSEKRLCMFRNTHYNDGGVYIQGKFALRSFEDSWKFDNQMASWLNLNEEGGAKYNCVWYPEKDYKGTPHIMTYNHKNVLLKQEINTASSVKCE